MPVLRYFVFVGASLLALIFVIGEAFPTPPAHQVADAAVAASDAPMIRINSDRKWPERVEFDTNAPTTAPLPAQLANNGVAAPAQTANVQPNVTVRDAFAQFSPPEMKKQDQKALQSARSRDGAYLSRCR